MSGVCLASDHKIWSLQPINKLSEAYLASSSKSSILSKGAYFQKVVLGKGLPL